MTISATTISMIIIVIAFSIFILILYVRLFEKSNENKRRIDLLEVRMENIENILSKLANNSDLILENQIVNKTNLSNLMETVSKHNFKIEWLEKHD